MAVTTDDRRVAEALAEIERLQSARGVQDAALACLRNDLRECAIRAERAEAERDAAEDASGHIHEDWVREVDRRAAAEAERDALRGLIRNDLLPRYEASCEYCKGSRYACDKLIDRLGDAACVARRARASIAAARKEGEG